MHLHVHTTHFRHQHQLRLISSAVLQHLTFKVKVGALSILVAATVALETAADGQLLQLTHQTVTNEVLLTAALPPALNTHARTDTHTVIATHTHPQTHTHTLTGAVMVQVACWWQPALSPEAQGSMGVQVNPSPVKPLVQLQLTCSPV